MNDEEEKKVEWHCNYYECANVINEDERFCESCLDKFLKEDIERMKKQGVSDEFAQWLCEHRKNR
jgi:hypothetical protein